MINKEMKDQSTNKDKASGKKPNEVNGLYFSSGIKIFDPNSKETIVHLRGDT